MVLKPAASPPHAPQSVKGTGISRSFLEDLALKTVFMRGELSLHDLSDTLCLGLSVVDELFLRLRREQLIEVKGMVAGVHNIAASGQGRGRALELLALNQYVGPAPVSISDYVERVRSQGTRDAELYAPDVERAFQHMVLSEHTLTQLGTAVVSGTSIFLYGPPGTGKTTIAEAIPRIYSDSIWIPYAVEVDGQVIVVHDPAVHVKAPAPSENVEVDRRWVHCHRPCIVTGGELTIEMLDLQLNAVTKFYSAPIQVRANNGVLIIDDFGRQRVRPDELLNRWIVPLDRHIDFLTLAGGKKFDVPFELFVIFATNLEPAKLADEAFLRRIPNKVHVDSVSPAQFKEILRRVCERFDVAYDDGAVREFIDLLTKDLKHPLRPCYARDIVQQISWSARYENKCAKLTPITIVRACGNYFLPGRAQA